jgi:UPF0716 family protein affecting phage T7 exclusion
MGEIGFGVTLLVLLCFFILGVAVLSDIIMDAVWRITSKVKLENIKREDGSGALIGVPSWNA